MKLITLEEHYSDLRIMEINNKYSSHPVPTSTPHGTGIFEDLTNFAKRVQYMDDNNVAIQVLSMTSPVGERVPNEEAIKACQLANNITKEHIDEYPGRFLGFATLPMCDPIAAAKELERCVKDMHFVGALLAGRYKGRMLNEKEFLPIFQKAEELDVPLYIHPAFIPPEVKKAYYDSDAYSPEVAFELSSVGYGWHSEVGIQTLRLILSGIFDKFPKLKIIIGHWGETVPCFLDRLDFMLDKKITGLKRNVSEYFKDNVYITPSGITSTDQLEYVVKLMGAEHVLYSIDYPYVNPKDPYGFLVNSSLTDEQKELIAYKNAERILNIKL